MIKILVLILLIVVIYYFYQKSQSKPVIPEKEDFKPVPKKKKPIKKWDDIIRMVSKKYLDTKYLFNISGQPVNTRTSNKDEKYLIHVRDNINEWQQIDKKIQVVDIKPLFVKEAGDEFVIVAVVKFKYQDRVRLLELSYYGKLFKNDEILNGGVDKCELQLIDVKKINEKTFDKSLKRVKKYSGPFATMSEQLDYVGKIHDMHKQEMA